MTIFLNERIGTHLRKGNNFLITENNVLIYEFDDGHLKYTYKEKKMFCFDDNDLMKHNIIGYAFDNMLNEEDWF